MTDAPTHGLISPIKRMIPGPIWRPLRAVATAIVTPFRFSYRTGHWRSSLAGAAYSARGAAIPWYTYPAIDFLSQRNFEGRAVLEFGGGQSTFWWAARARSVLTIEEDAEWYAWLRPRVAGNVDLHHVPVDHVTRTVAPVKAVLDANPIRAFDVIVVDGHLRQEVTTLAFDYLASGGAMILDNAEGYGFYDSIKGRDCRRIDFFGFAPGISMRHCTSIVYVGDCFLLKPDIPIPVIESVTE